MPQVIVTVDPAGEVKVEAQGITGSGCQQLTSAIERALGETTADVKKPEYLCTQDQTNARQKTSTGGSSS